MESVSTSNFCELGVFRKTNSSAKDAAVQQDVSVCVPFSDKYFGQCSEVTNLTIRTLYLAKFRKFKW